MHNVHTILKHWICDKKKTQFWNKLCWYNHCNLSTILNINYSLCISYEIIPYIFSSIFIIIFYCVHKHWRRNVLSVQHIILFILFSLFWILHMIVIFKQLIAFYNIFKNKMLRKYFRIISEMRKKLLNRLWKQ